MSIFKSDWSKWIDIEVNYNSSKMLVTLIQMKVNKKTGQKKFAHRYIKEYSMLPNAAAERVMPTETKEEFLKSLLKEIEEL